MPPKVSLAPGKPTDLPEVSAANWIYAQIRRPSAAPGTLDASLLSRYRGNCWWEWNPGLQRRFECRSTVPPRRSASTCRRGNVRQATRRECRLRPRLMGDTRFMVNPEKIADGIRKLAAY